MKRVVLLVPILFLLACSPIEQNARDTAAALQGAITTAQSQYQASCTQQPTAKECQIINQAVAGQNALVTAVEAYCGWSPTNPPNPTTTKCVPVTTAKAGLQTAIANAQLFISEVRGVIKQ